MQVVWYTYWEDPEEQVAFDNADLTSGLFANLFERVQETVELPHRYIPEPYKAL